MKESTKVWIEYASHDLDAAKKLIEEDHLRNIVAFHCQQVIEKIFKALLEEFSSFIPKIHSVVKLYSLLPQNIKLKLQIKLEDLRKVRDIYIESRYPTLIGFLPNGYPDKTTTLYFYNLSKSIYEKSLKLLEE